MVAPKRGQTALSTAEPVSAVCGIVDWGQSGQSPFCAAWWCGLTVGMLSDPLVTQDRGRRVGTCSADESGAAGVEAEDGNGFAPLPAHFDRERTASPGSSPKAECRRRA